ncbi:MAG: peptidylprolyl isomerase [Planctomycetia bacterium]|nr:peptidylprolyl isomerase [Planctomycetia bacterium]
MTRRAAPTRPSLPARAGGVASGARPWRAVPRRALAMRALARVVGPVLACAVLAGCASRPRPSGSGGPATDVAAPVASVGAERVTKAELSDFLHARFREAWLDALDELVDERIVAIEARALGVTVPAPALAAAVDAEVEARRRQLVEQFGPSADLEASVKAYYGLDVAGWRAKVLEPRLRTRLALARVVRLSSRLREQVIARVLVVKDRPTADAVRAKLDRGADFSLTALEVSVDPSRNLGGVIPPIARGDLARPDLEAALFGAAPGTVLGPLEVRSGAAVEWHLYKVVERVPAWGGPPSSLLPRLEDDLAKSPVTRAEFERWSSRTRARYGVRYFAPDGSVLPGGGGGR